MDTSPTAAFTAAPIGVGQISIRANRLSNGAQPGTSGNHSTSPGSAGSSANELLSPIDDGMPVIPGTRDFEPWLEPSRAVGGQTLLRLFPSDRLAASP
jgi:putative SOS response-associated peptidase YedK